LLIFFRRANIAGRVDTLTRELKFRALLVTRRLLPMGMSYKFFKARVGWNEKWRERKGGNIVFCVVSMLAFGCG
jgi:hypothetical protein